MTYSAIKEVSRVLDEKVYKDPQRDNADHESSWNVLSLMRGLYQIPPLSSLETLKGMEESF